MKTYTVQRGHWDSRGRFVGEVFDCDELPDPLYTAPYVDVRLNVAVSREVVEDAQRQ